MIFRVQRFGNWIGAKIHGGKDRKHPVQFRWPAQGRRQPRFQCQSALQVTEANEGGIYNKLLVIQTGSILEAALAEIIWCAQNHTKEGVPTIEEPDRQSIEKKDVETFNTIINVSQKYKVLDALGADIYDELHKLRKYQNKVHIQKKIDIDNVSTDDGPAFSDAVRTWAFALNIRVLKYLSERLPRPKTMDVYFGTLVVPT
jgi:phosphoribosylformylglycinamidine (FGAM) synthase PurS component